MKTKILSVLTLTVVSSAFALTSVEITTSNIADYSSLQDASWIGGEIYGLDFGNGYGPNSYNKFTEQQGSSDGSDYFYTVSTSTLAQGFIVDGTTQYIKKITAGGGNWANSLVVVDADYDFNNLYWQNPQYKNVAGEQLNYSTVATDGTVYGAAIKWEANADGSFNKVTASTQDINLTGVAFVLDFSESFSNGIKTGTVTLMSYNNASKYGGSNSFYYTLDGENYIECVAGTASVNNYSYDLNGVTLDFERVTVDGITSVNIAYSVPEPSTYAMIFGVLALAFVVYRRKK